MSIGIADNIIMLMEYLVASKSKERLLRLLWQEDVVATVSDLSRMAEVSYAAAYEELKRMESAGLAVSERVGNSLCYRANVDTPQAETLRTLLGKVPDTRTVRDEDVLWNLNQLGGPVAVTPRSDGKPFESLTPEQTLVFALKLAHRSPTVARALPVALASSYDRLNQQRMSFLAKRSKEQMALGFFLELTGELTARKEFIRWARQLRDHRVRRARDFFEGSKSSYERELARLNTPKLAAKWHFVMNMGFDSFASLFEKHETIHHRRNRNASTGNR